MQGSGWISQSDDEYVKATGWSLFLLRVAQWFLQKIRNRIYQTFESFTRHRSMAASYVCYRTYKPCKQAYTKYSVCTTNLRAIRILIKKICCSLSLRLQS
jgi:hypothetical protein